jgi:cell division protein FtsW
MEMQIPAARVTRPGEAAALRGLLLGTVATLLAAGLVFVYSASAIRAGASGWELRFLVRQCLYLGVGLGGLGVFALLDPRWLRRLWVPVLIGTLLLLALVRVPGIGTEVRSAWRWFRIGPISIQPSEIAKLGLVIAVSAVCARSADRRLPFLRGLVPAGAILLAGCGLVAIEPDIGTAALLGAVLGAVCLVAGARLLHITGLGLAAAVPVAWYGWHRFDYIRDRIAAWREGATLGAGWQPYMSKVALGSGGLTGTGLGEGPAKLYYLPDAHTDFILPIAGQELGLAATLGVVVCFALLVAAGLGVVRRAPDRFTRLLAFGITFTIGLQAAFNMAVVTGSIPPKGISLPFVSYGGSGLCVMLAGVGILLGILRLADRVAAGDASCGSVDADSEGEPDPCA